MKRDSSCVWHPYTQHGNSTETLVAVRGKGAWIELENGGRVLDAISSWWVNVVGHGNPSVAKAIASQAKTLEHVIFAGFTHEPAVVLAETLVGAVRKRGAQLSRVFYSDNGSTAVEVALKMAYQQHKNLGNSTRNRFLALHGSYHGDTFGAMAVGEPSGFHPCFRPLLAPVDFVQPNDISGIRNLLQDRGEQYAAFIVEPLVQGAGGMRFHTPEYLNKAVALCRDSGLLVIFDEVFTGFYRTGSAFAFEQSGVTPDLLCLSKGITGGFLPLGVTMATENTFLSFHSEKLSEAFLHGHSYTANPIACAAAVATWAELHTAKLQKQIKMIARVTASRVARLSSHPAISATRCLGTIGVVEFSGEVGYFAKQAPWIRAEAIKRGVLLRPLGNVIYTVPPYVIQASELERVYDVIHEILELIESRAQSSSSEQAGTFLATDV